VLFACGSGYAAQKDVKEIIALFPFENLSEDKNALAAVMPAVKLRLEAKGFQVLDEEKLNDFLLRERIRSTGYVSRDVARRLGEELNVKAVLVGSVNSFLTGDDPRIGLSARLVSSSDGSILWANHSSAAGDDFTTILGLGRITAMDKLSSRVVDKLLDSLRTSYADKEMESTYRIAVMPFQNSSKVKDAGLIATYLFITELFKDKKFIPLEYGEVKRLVVDLRVREKGELDFKKTERISESAGVDGILVGTVDVYKEKDGTAPPEAGMSARLIDARRDKILWGDSFGSKGDDDIVALDWGRINTAENVAYKVVSKLLKGMGKARWQ
jgi:TolB-like protein